DGEMPEQRAGRRKCRVACRARRLDVNEESLDAAVTVGDGEDLASPFLEHLCDAVKPCGSIELDDGEPAERRGRDAACGEMPDRRDVHPRTELLDQARRREPVELGLGTAEEPQAADRRRQHMYAFRADP